MQSRIAKGLFGAAEFEDWFVTFVATAKKRGAALEAPFVCPHRYSDLCECKKPSTLLCDQASHELGLAPANSFVIGDTPDDIRAAIQFGAQPSGACLLLTHHPGSTEL